MKTIVGKLMVYLGLKFRIRLITAYLFLWLLAAVVGAVVVVADDGVKGLSAFVTDAANLVVGAVMVVWFGIILPIIWHFTSGGLIWKVPDKDTMGLLFPKY